MPLCARCHTNPRRTPKQRWCTPCHNAFVREWRRTHPLTEEQKRRDTCRAYAQVYKTRGKLNPVDLCELCHQPGPLQMHHADYDRPLLVLWVHRACGQRIRDEHLTIDTTRARFAELAARMPVPSFRAQ